MAEELLGINKSSLDAIGQAIRNKGGTNSMLSFPSGMVSALQAITTEATVTPKITPQQKVLTQNDTQFSIDAGFHDGTGTVSIQLDTTNNSANPTSTQQTYYPDTGKFFGSFTVGGTGNGVIVVMGETTVSSSNNITISGLSYNGASFTPHGLIAAIKTGNGASYTYTGFVYDKDFTNDNVVPLPYTRNGKAGGVKTATQITRQSGSVSVGGSYNSSYFNGTYSYVVWGA